MQISHALVTALIAALSLFAADARGDDWTTVGSDAQRSSWVRADQKISPATVKAPDFRPLWRKELAAGEALTGPVLLDFLISHRGFRSLAFLGSGSGSVFAVDTDLARMEWVRRYPAAPGGSTDGCPGGMTANLTRPTAAAMPSLLGFGARGRRTPAKSGVGEPGQGAVTLVEQPPRSTAAARPPSTTRTRPPAQRALRGVTLVHALTADGMLRTLYVSNGRDRVPPIPFLPPSANAGGLIVVDGVAYVTTSNGCGGAPDAVWALDLETGDVATWNSPGGAAGLAGVAFGPDGTVYAATRNGSLAALRSRSLDVQANGPSGGYRSSPLVLDIDGQDHVAVVARDGSLRVFDTQALDEAVATAPAAAGGAGDTALASWRDSGGTRWILAPSEDSLVAWKLDTGGDAARIAKGWESPNMRSPLPAIVVDGVVFALDGGGAAGPARLYALDGLTGSELWDSGDAIKASVSGHTLAAGPGHVFLAATDGAAYAFGFPMEH